MYSVLLTGLTRAFILLHSLYFFLETGLGLGQWLSCVDKILDLIMNI